MRKKINWTAILIAMVVCAYIANTLYSVYNNNTDPLYSSDSITIPAEDTAFRNAFYNPVISDSLPYYSYRKLQDSISRIKAEIEWENKGRLEKASYTGFIGFTILKNYYPKSYMIEQSNPNYLLGRLDSIEMRITRTTNKDSILMLNKKAGEFRDVINGTRTWEDVFTNGKKEYFISFNDIKLRENNHFFVQHGHYYLAYPVWDSTKKNGEYSNRSGHYKRMPLKIRYNKDQQAVLIPASRAWYNFISIIYTVLIIGFFILSFYITIGMPISILGSVSNGQVFTSINIRQLKIIYTFLFILAGLKAIYPFLKTWLVSIFAPRIFETTSLQEALYAAIPLLIAGLAVYLICKAFKKGYKLQQEQDYTV